MDAARFDRLARSLTTIGSRRRALTMAASGALGTLGVAGTEAKKKKPCPPCKQRKKGKCKGTLPDGTACTGGTCQGGSCVAAQTPPPPTCTVCGDECVNTLTNRDHCGRCNRLCDTGKVCRNGGCFATCPATTTCGPITPCGNTNRCNCLQRADGNDKVCVWTGGEDFPVLCEDLIDCSVNPCPSGQVCVDRCCGALTKFCIIPCPDQA